MNKAGISLPVVILIALAGRTGESARAADEWVVYEGGDGPGKGKHIVFVSGDEEYRSEEALPQLAKIMAKHHGFKCTVLFAIDPKDGTINPNKNDNIPGLEALDKADLMVIFTRFRNLPDEQMKHIVDYVEAGKPIVGLRTATHAFALSSKTYANYTWTNKAKDSAWDGGFGRHILGETWVNHWVGNGSLSTRGILVKDAEKNPILKGIKDADIWGPTGVYEVRLPLADDCTPLVLGEVVNGMKPTDKRLEGKKNDPMMPVAWTKASKTKDGKATLAFTTTMGASQDFESEGLRRLLVNASFWALGLEKKITPKLNVDFVGEYKPRPYGNDKFEKALRPADLAIK
jgi:hypothetical protein